jgi:hypothetical protein
MYCFRLFAAAAGFALLVSTTAFAQADARTLIEDAAAAHGGQENLAKYAAARIKVKGSYVVQGQPVPYLGQSVYLMPDRVRSTVELTIKNVARTVEQIQNGDRSAMLVAGLAQQVTDAQAQELKMSLYCQNLARFVPLLKDSKYTLSTAGEKTIDAKRALGVRVSHPGRKDVTLYFDADSHLLVMLERPGVDANGAKTDQQEFYTDFRTANGLKYAGKTRVVQNGKVTLESEVLEFQPLERVDAKEFALPP